MSGADIADKGLDAPVGRLRIFVGVKIAGEIAKELAQMARVLEQSPAKLIAPAEIHLTLVPPWNVSDPTDVIEPLGAIVGGFAAFMLTFAHLGYGPQPRWPRFLWVDCSAPDALATIRAALLHTFGPSDERPFRPHVTLARLRDSGAAIARRHPIDRELSFTQRVATIELFRSPPPGAAGYQVLASLPLRAYDGSRPAV